MQPRTAAHSRERGAALILTVIVIMVLTTLGLAMVAFTTTEERTASTYRDTLQARALSEAGVRVVQEMFRTPLDRDLVPLHDAAASAPGAGYDYYGVDPNDIEPRLNAIGIWRAVRTGAVPARYSGNLNRFFFPPFRDTWAQTFGGSFSTSTDVYDLKFNCRNPETGALIANWQTTCWLETNINALLQTSTDWNQRAGTITDISFYAPPIVNGRAYGITTVRVTAEKYDNQGSLLARETTQAVIGDANLEPAMLGHGNVTTGNVNGCGDGCEQLHANGNITTSGDWEDGDPALAATGSINGSLHSAGAVLSPEINPWDLAYKPTTTSNLNDYYLVTARQLDVVWTDGTTLGNPAARACGLASYCQDYNLEVDNAGAEKTLTRSATGTCYLYQWDATGQGWTQRDFAVSGDNSLVYGGWDIRIARAVDTTGPPWTDDNARSPFLPNRVPATVFQLESVPNGATLLADGKVDKDGNVDFILSLIAVGSIDFHGHTNMSPSMNNRIMVVAGRDFKTHSSFNNNIHNMCNSGGPPTTAQQSRAGIIAVHEQINASAQTSLMGVIIAENRVDHDTLVTRGGTNQAINMGSGDHAFMCDSIDWPWVRPTKPVILSMTTATE